MGMEKIPNRKDEPFVPREKRREFVTAAHVGDMRAEDSKEMEIDAKKKRTMAKASLGISAVATSLGVAATLTGNPLAGAGGIFTGMGAALNAKALKKEAKLFSSGAVMEKEQSEEAYTKSRGIVEEEMRRTGAEEVKGELRVTPEQIEIARKDMGNKLRDRRE